MSCKTFEKTLIKVRSEEFLCQNYFDLQRVLFSERTRSAVYNGAVYNGVKMFHSGSQLLRPTKA